ncbi:aminodeoxychorismate lyase [Salinisphaera aquimarina]|uniref:Aminodeoxychorismate lyase n=1 Tax=Salinisphaera aquimarina TaxID=2094031 RepID=A0ABV7ENT7_9GAMM
MAEQLLVDGQWSQSVPADDRGLAYGDGVFRTLRVTAGIPLAWDIHMQRLAHDCAQLQLPVPDAKCLADDAARLFADKRDGVLKIMMTRGSGGRGYMPPADSGRRIVSAHPLPVHVSAAPLDMDRSPIVLASQPRLAGVKHLNRLEQVLARAECARSSQPDAFMCDGDGWLIATTMRNLFFQDSNGHWLTPALTQAGIIGATRQQLMAVLERAGTTAHEIDVGVSSLTTMRAAIACNSVGGVVAVHRMADVRFADSDAACAYCRRLMEAEWGSRA